jgi:type IV pilus assembly protein PilF
MKKTNVKVLLLLLIFSLSSCVTIKEPAYEKEGNKEEKIQVYTNAAAKYLQENEPTFAKRHLENALEVDPKSARVHELLALTFRMTGELDLAEEHYQKMAKYSPEYTRGHYNYATFLLQQNKINPAIEQLELAAKDTLYSGRANVFKLLGYAYVETNEKDKAIENYKKAALIDRMDVGSMINLSWLYWDNSEFNEATVWYKKADALTGIEKITPTARHLLMGIRIAYREGDKNAQASNELTLRNMYPNSEIYQQYKKEFLK